MDVGVARNDAAALAFLVADQPCYSAGRTASLGGNGDVEPIITLAGGAEGTADAEPEVPEPAWRLRTSLVSTAGATRSCPFVVMGEFAGQSFLETATVSSCMAVTTATFEAEVPKT